MPAPRHPQGLARRAAEGGTQYGRVIRADRFGINAATTPCDASTCSLGEDYDHQHAAAQRFIQLRRQLTELRARVQSGDAPLTEAHRDIVAVAQAEALCDIAATLDDGITVFG